MKGMSLRTGWSHRLELLEIFTLHWSWLPAMPIIHLLLCFVTPHSDLFSIDNNDKSSHVHAGCVFCYSLPSAWKSFSTNRMIILEMISFWANASSACQTNSAILKVCDQGERSNPQWHICSAVMMTLGWGLSVKIRIGTSVCASNNKPVTFGHQIWDAAQPL